MKLPEKFAPRVCMTVGGVMLCALAVGFFKCSIFGVDPFQCFAQGMHGSFLAKVASYGTFYTVLSLIMLVADLFLDKHYIGIATFINLFLTGYVAAFSEQTINAVLPDPSLMARIIMLAIGIVVMCFASAFYMTSDLGVSVYDAIPIVISNRTKKPFRYVRITADLICVIIGVTCILIGGLNLAAYVGVGTIVTAFFMGPLIEFFNNTVARPLLYGKEEARRMKEAIIAEQKAAKEAKRARRAAK